MASSRSKQNSLLPFFPTYESEVRGNVSVVWFPKNFSQSFYNTRQIECSSNACTLIAILIASKFYYNEIEMAEPSIPLRNELIYAIANSILEGNRIHETNLKRGVFKHLNLTVPDAIRGGGNGTKYVIEWKCALYMTDMSKTFFKNLNGHISEWRKTSLAERSNNLFIVVIADQRSVLFVIQDKNEKAVLIDSHQHLSHGAVVAQVHIRKLKSLCNWYINMNLACYAAQPDCYELSFLYYPCCKHQ